MPRPQSAIQDVRYQPPRAVGVGFEPIPVDELRRRASDGSLGGYERLDFHVLLFPRGGWTRHEVDFTAVRMGPGWAAHGAPGQVQRFFVGPQSRGVLVAVRPDFLPSAHPLARAGAARLRIAPGAERWVDELVRLYGETPLPAEALTHLLLALLARLEPDADRAPEASDGARALHRAFVGLVDAHFAAQREVAWYARRLGYVERTIARACHEVEGAGPKAVIDRRVALEAKRLLAYTTLTVSQIGARLGFSEVTNFVKFFRRSAGTTPLAFRVTARGAKGAARGGRRAAPSSS